MPRFVTNTAFIAEDEMYSDFPTDEDRHDDGNYFSGDEDEEKDHKVQMPTIDRKSTRLNSSHVD